MRVVFKFHGWGVKEEEKELLKQLERFGFKFRPLVDGKYKFFHWLGFFDVGYHIEEFETAEKLIWKLRSFEGLFQIEDVRLDAPMRDRYTHLQVDQFITLYVWGENRQLRNWRQ